MKMLADLTGVPLEQRCEVEHEGVVFRIAYSQFFSPTGGIMHLVSVWAEDGARPPDREAAHEIATAFLDKDFFRVPDPDDIPFPPSYKFGKLTKD